MTGGPSAPYSPDFYDAHREGARESAEVVVPLLMHLVSPRSVVDVGCGTGTWLAEFASRGVEDVIGIDGDYVPLDRLEIGRERFIALDLATPFDLDRRFDLVLCLEVAEHLPEASAPEFIHCLTRLGGVIVFSAAVPHQGGENHVNEQWPAWWSALFARHGFTAIDCLRSRIWTDPRVRWWYAQNMIVYASEEATASLPNLAAEQSEPPLPPLPLVHPDCYLECVRWGQEQCRKLYEDG